MNWLDSRTVFLCLIVVGYAAHPVALIVAVLGLGGQVLLSCLQLLASTRSPAPAQESTAERLSCAPRFSVHVATHEEPPAMVLRTLNALSQQTGFPDYEVIVLDNNTADPALWQPVEALCKELGPRFRFYHEDGVQGAKAGALNIALDRTNPQATHVVVVDADYEVAPDFLATAVVEICQHNDDFLQFPQAYRSDDGSAAGISLELADYFLRHARQADGADAMLLTGTLSVIRRSALEKAGGWSSQTITEDAELGLRLRRLGYRGRFVDRVIGRGILPLDLSGLEQQRYRWSQGNLRTILQGVSGLSLNAAFHVASQLTAWANLALPLAGVLIGGGIALALGSQAEQLSLITTLAGMGLVLVFVSASLPLIMVALVSGRTDLATVLAAISARIALVLQSAIGTADALLGQRGTFRRTSKDSNDAHDRIGICLPLLAAMGVALLAVPSLPPMAAAGAALLILPFPLALNTRMRLAAYRTAIQTGTSRSAS